MDNQKNGLDTFMVKNSVSNNLSESGVLISIDKARLIYRDYFDI